jgi:hypothetical protein
MPATRLRSVNVTQNILCCIKLQLADILIECAPAYAPESAFIDSKFFVC